MRNIFFQTSCRKWGKETSSKPLFGFQKRFVWGKSNWSAAYFQYISIVLNWVYNKNKLYKTLGYYWSRDLLNFDFLENCLEMVSPPHFVHDFSRHIFLMLHAVNWPNSIVWLPLLLEITGNMCTALVCFLGCDVINFEINLIFPTKPFFYMNKKLRPKFKYLENEKRLKVKRKAFFIIFKKLSVPKNCLRPESASVTCFALKVLIISSISFFTRCFHSEKDSSGIHFLLQQKDMHLFQLWKILSVASLKLMLYFHDILAPWNLPFST